MGTGPPSSLPPSPLPPQQLQAPIASEQPGRMVSWLFFVWLLLFLLVSVIPYRGTTGLIVSCRGGCLGICTASWHGTGAPAFSLTPGAIDGRLGLCCCRTDACSWPTLKGQDIPWFRLAIYCQGCQHLRHSYPAKPSVPLRPSRVPAASPWSEPRGVAIRAVGRGGRFSSLLLRNVFHLALPSAICLAHPSGSWRSILFPPHSACLTM